MTPQISVVLPSYLGSAEARSSVRRIGAFFEERNLTGEVIIVDDGGGDYAEAEWDSVAGVRVIRFPKNRGKGAAVRTGMLAARGAVRIYTDVDLPFDLDLFDVMVEYIQTRGFHLVVGDRTLPDSRYAADLSWRRRVASGIFSWFVGTLVTGGFHDTQCGLKAFRGDVAEALFRKVQIDRFAFDVEVLYLALVYRLDIKRIPVQLRNNETSSVRLGRDSAQMLLDVLKIKRNQMAGQYESPELAGILSSEFQALRGQRARPT